MNGIDILSIFSLLVSSLGLFYFPYRRQQTQHKGDRRAEIPAFVGIWRARRLGGFLFSKWIALIGPLKMFFGSFRLSRRSIHFVPHEADCCTFFCSDAHRQTEDKFTLWNTASHELLLCSL